MSALNSGEMNASFTGDETHSLGSHGVEDVGNAAASSSVTITLEEVARQIKAATNPLIKRLEKLCNLMKELQQDTCKRNEETFGLIQVPSKSRGDSSDSCPKCNPRVQRIILQEKNWRKI